MIVRLCLNYLKCETDLCLVEVNLLPFRVCLTDTSHLFLLARAGVKTWLYLLLGFPNEYAKFMTITVYRTIKIQQRTTNHSLLSIFIDSINTFTVWIIAKLKPSFVSYFFVCVIVLFYVNLLTCCPLFLFSSVYLLKNLHLYNISFSWCCWFTLK